MLNSASTSRAYLVIDRQNSLRLPPHPDYLVVRRVDDSANISINQVRTLIHWATLKPFSKSKKVILVRQGQEMTPAAQNALLKVLEEPPERTIIILAVDNEKNLLPAVVSRCLKTETGRLMSEISELSTSAPRRHPLASGPQIPTSVPQGFKLAASLAKKERQEIITTLDRWALELHHSLLESPSLKTLDQIKKIKYTGEALRANVNKRLALENLFLALQ